MIPEDFKTQAAFLGLGSMGLLTFVYRFLRNMKSDATQDKLIERMIGEITILQANNKVLYDENKSNSLTIGKLSATVEFQTKALLEAEEENEKLELRLEKLTVDLTSSIQSYQRLLSSPKNIKELEHGKS